MNAMFADWFWAQLVQDHEDWLGPPNPNNELITNLFGNQGGYWEERKRMNLIDFYEKPLILVNYYTFLKHDIYWELTYFMNIIR